MARRELYGQVQWYQSSTASCRDQPVSRVRGEPNDFNVIDISDDHITIERYGFNEDSRLFEAAEARQFNRASEIISD